MLRRFQVVTDWLVPPRLAANPTSLWRARLLILISLLGFVWGPFFAPVHYYFADAPRAAVALVVAGALAAMAPLVLRWTESLVVTANMLLAVVYGIVVIVTAARGGFPVSGLMWSSTIPMVALFVVGRRTAAFWLVLVGLKFGGLGVATVAGYGLPINMPEKARLILDGFGLLTFLILLSSIAAIYETERRRALGQAEEASRAKTDFLARMSHEIRTPMNGVVGMTSLLFGTELTPTQRQYAQTIRQSGSALLKIVNEILDFSKLEAGKMPLEPMAFDLRQELGQLTELFAPRAQAKGLELTVDVAPDVPRVFFGDIGRLRQILVNLLGNSLKFTDHGSVGIEVRVADSSEVYQLEISVTDTGIGISPEDLPTIFDPFSQAVNAASSRFEGTGLGLAICRHLSEMMGGSIDVESQLGKGSRFRLLVALEPSTDEAESELPELSASVPLRRGHGELILVAEDNPVNQQVTSFMLESLGYVVDVVASGSEALDALEHGHYDLVLMDCRMPEMDGYEATQRIRQIPELADLPILAMTANAFPEDRDRCLAIGMNGYLSKPVHPEELARALSRSLDSSTSFSPVE